MFSEESYYLYNEDSSMKLNLINYVLSYDFHTVNKNHCHHYLELNLIKSGKGFYKVEGKKYEMLPGDIFVFNNIEIHELYITPGSVLEWMVVHFEPQFIWTQGGNMIDYRFLKIFFERNENFQNRLDRNNPATNDVKNLLLEMETEFRNQQPGFDLAIKINLLQILTLCFRRSGYVLQETNKYFFSKYNLSLMKSVMEYIDEHIAEDIKLEDLASFSNLSPSYFSGIFKKCNGLSPIEYIQGKRIQKAVELLKYCDKSILKIAELCGFNNISNFYKAFKKVTGSVPTDFREGE